MVADSGAAPALCGNLRRGAPKRKVAAKDSATFGGLVHDLSGDASSLNTHGARSGSAAFGPGSNDPENPPSNSAINEREGRAKQRVIAAQIKKGFAVGSDAGVDEIRKIRQRPLTRDELLK